MIDFIKKYIPYICIIGFGLYLIIFRKEYGIGVGLSLGLCSGYYYGIDKKIIKH